MLRNLDLVLRILSKRMSNICDLEKSLCGSVKNGLDREEYEGGCAMGLLEVRQEQ